MLVHSNAFSIITIKTGHRPVASLSYDENILTTAFWAFCLLVFDSSVLSFIFWGMDRGHFISRVFLSALGEFSGLPDPP